MFFLLEHCQNPLPTTGLPPNDFSLWQLTHCWVFSSKTMRNFSSSIWLQISTLDISCGLSHFSSRSARCWSKILGGISSFFFAWTSGGIFLGWYPTDIGFLFLLCHNLGLLPMPLCAMWLVPAWSGELPIALPSSSGLTLRLVPPIQNSPGKLLDRLGVLSWGLWVPLGSSEPRTVAAAIFLLQQSTLPSAVATAASAGLPNVKFAGVVWGFL